MNAGTMEIWRRLVRLGALLALGACTAQEFTVRNPDGSERTFRHVELHPHLVVRPDQFEVRSAGTTDDGFPIEEITRRDGKGFRYYRVTPPVGEPLFFRETPRPRRAEPTVRPSSAADEAPTPIFPESAPCSEVRVTVAFDPERAVLEGRSDGGAWIHLAQGSFEQAAMAAARHGMTPLEFRNDFGTWSVAVDRRFPLATVRLHGAVVQVRGLR